MPSLGCCCAPDQSPPRRSRACRSIPAASPERTPTRRRVAGPTRRTSTITRKVVGRTGKAVVVDLRDMRGGFAGLAWRICRIRLSITSRRNWAARSTPGRCSTPAPTVPYGDRLAAVPLSGLGRRDLGTRPGPSARYGASGRSRLSCRRRDGAAAALPLNAAVNAAARSVAGRAWRYRLVVVSCDWPIASLTLTRSTPPATSRDPNVWRRSCQRSGGSPAASRARL